MDKNTLYYGDNLEILRRYVKEETVDLVYLDPPFNSNQDYNVLFKEQDGTRAAAQIKAFGDTWRWDRAAAQAYEETVVQGGKVAQVMLAFRTFLGENDLLAYLAMMAPRLMELRRVLKPTGSIYMHCDPTASHYLKMLMDAVFDPRRFRNEIIWKRTHAHGSSYRCGPVHDVLLFYSKGDDYTWTRPKVDHGPEYIRTHFRRIDERTGRRFQPITLTGSGVRRGHSGKAWRHVDPTSVGRHWALPGALLEELGIVGDTPQEKLEAMDAAGLIYWPDKTDGTPRLKWYADNLSGVVLSDVWTDIPPISAQAKERLGYPTQKPEALLERIIQASSNEGDVVLDPFCGCGTTVAAAQKLGRRWIGIDITCLAISLIKHRLKDAYGEGVDYEVIGEPVAPHDAARLAREDRYQFQWWALGLVGARPVEEKKGADKGIDGRLYFQEGRSEFKQIIFSVKSGKVGVGDVRDLRAVVEREKAQIGVLLTLAPPTQAMRTEAASCGFYESPWGKHPRLQLLTVGELLVDGKKVDYPSTPGANVTFKKAPKAKGKKVKAAELPLDG